MKLKFMREETPADFSAPGAPPASADQRSRWQASNRTWWERHPMRYDFIDPVAEPEFSPQFFREIDRRFLKSISQEAPWRTIPFDTFIDFDRLRQQSVLEIGVGCGTHAELLTRRAGRYVGIDLTEYAVRATSTRLGAASLPVRIARVDAERLAFPDATFDFVWSWGVIHHSSHTREVLREIARVLRPGGRCTVMVYHRSPWNEFVRGGLYYGLLRGGFFRGKSIHTLLQETTDGALARYYTADDWNRDVSDYFTVSRTWLLGHSSQLIPLPWGPLKERLSDMLAGRFTRWLTNRPSFAYMIVTELQKI